MQHPSKQLEAQILVILLIALSILSIFVVVIASTTRRDVVERVQNEKYEQALSTAEEKLLKYVEGEILVADNNSTCNETAPDTYQCTDVPEEGSADTIITTVTTENLASLNNAPPLTIEKDSSLRLKLENYQGSIVFDYVDLATTWLISVDYYKGGEGYKTVKDVHNGSNFFPNNITHCAGFLEVVDNNSLRVRLDQLVGAGKCIPGVATEYQFLSLRLKPFITTDITSLNAESAGFPGQFRLITSESYSVSGTSTESPTVVLELIEPLYDSPIELFDYVLRTEEEVLKP